MRLPSALDARESILCLYRSKAERTHAMLHFLLSGIEQRERVFSVLDQQSAQLARFLVEHVASEDSSMRHRGLPAETFAGQGPLEVETVVERVVAAARAWRGRPPQRPMRVVVDLHYVIAALGSARDILELSRRISTLTAHHGAICLCLLFREHVPKQGLGTFLESFTRILAAEPALSTRARSPRYAGSEELDAVLDSLLLSDEAVIEQALEGSPEAIEHLDARAFFNVAGDDVLILDRNLGVRYANPSLAAWMQIGHGSRRGTSLAAFCSREDFARIERVVYELATDSLTEGAPVKGIVSLSLTRADGAELAFEVSVGPLVAYGRLRGFVCVLRRRPEGLPSAEARSLPRGSAGTVASGNRHRHDTAGFRRQAPYRRALPAELVRSRSLTIRETEVLELTLNGKSIDEIADRLAIAPVTVKKHRTNGYRKLGIRDRFELLSLSDTTG